MGRVLRRGIALLAAVALGGCGNSGNSTEPHVHLQAMDGADVLEASAVPVTFGGRLPGSNEVVAKDPQLLKRSLELSAYFTIPKIEVPHRQLALLNAMTLATRNKNYNSALSFANRMLANGGGPAKALESVSVLCVCTPERRPLTCETGPQDQGAVRA